MRAASFVALSAIVFLRTSSALPSNDTLPVAEDDDYWALRPRTMMAFDENGLRDDCFGVRMRSIGSALGNPDTRVPGRREQVGPPECEAAAPGRLNGGLYYRELSPPIKSTTKIGADTSLSWKTPKVVHDANHNPLRADPYTCDHVLEISMVLQVLRAPGGVCETAKEKYNAGASDGAKQAIQRDMQNKIIKIRDIVNKKPNLIFFQKRIEEIKTQNKVNFDRNRNNYVRAGSNDMDYMAVADYLLRKTSVQGVANQIDAKIKELFGEDVANVASIGKYWKDYIQFTRHVESNVERSIKDQVKRKKQEEEEAKKAKAQCPPKPGTGPSGPWGQPRPPWGQPPAGQTGGASSSTGGTSLARRVVRRQRLHRRAPAVRGASRSGPHAPPARACPLPGQQPKPIVPRSQMQIKPAPATRPRVPVQKPPVKPAPAKKVVPRPANRPRREIGKPAPPKKRVTPKKQPKRAPKPPNAPKGKPRPRRRK